MADAMATGTDSSGATTELVLNDPAKSYGLLDVWRRRYLTRLLIRKEVRVRYQGSALGLLWTYVKPLIRYLVYFLVFGYVLGIGERIENFAIYVFAGLVVVTFFNEALSSATRSVRGNAPLLNKIFLPREMFPLVSVMVSTWHFVPQVVVLLFFAVVSGWAPTWTAVGYALAAFVMVFLFVVGMGLLFSTLNVFFRDAEQIVEIVTLLAFWSAPVMYAWTFVRDVIGDGALLTLYLSNPLAIAVEFFHQAFWAPTVAEPTPAPDLSVAIWVASGVVVILLVAGQYVFANKQGRFVQEL